MLHKVWWRSAIIALLFCAVLALGLVHQTEAQSFTQLQPPTSQTYPQFDSSSTGKMCWLNRWDGWQSPGDDKHCRHYNICWQNQWDDMRCRNGRDNNVANGRGNNVATKYANYG